MLTKKISFVLMVAISILLMSISPSQDVNYELNIISLDGVEQSFKIMILNENDDDTQITDVQFTVQTTPYHKTLDDGDYTIVLENSGEAGLKSKVKRVVEGKVRSEVTSDERKVRFLLHTDGHLSANGY